MSKLLIENENDDLNKKYLTKSKTMIRAIIRAKTTKLGTKLGFFTAYQTVKSYQQKGIIPEICEFKISEFLDTMDVKSSAAYRKIKKNGVNSTAIRSEMNKVLTFQFSVPNSKEVLEKIEFKDSDYTTYNLFTKTWTANGKCYFGVNKDVFASNFIDLKKGEFMQTPLAVVSQHKNDYVVRFYDYFKSFLHNSQFIYNKTFKVNNLKVLLGVETAKSYVKNIGSLKQRILEPAIKEINKNTDIIIKYEFKKNDNNKITDIKFIARLKSDITFKKSDKKQESNKDKEINNILEKLDEDNVWNI